VFTIDVPEIEVKRNVVHSGTGIESEMTCIVSAYPEAIIKWYKGDKEIVQKKGIMMHHGIMKGNRTKHVLKILHTSSRDFGDYKCSAENAIGKDSKLITLTGNCRQNASDKIYHESSSSHRELIIEVRKGCSFMHAFQEHPHSQN
jgi:hypothetical protein